MENHWQTCSWSRHCTLSRHCLSNFGFGLVLCLTSGPKQNVKNTVHPLVYRCHQLVPSIVSTSEFWVRRKFTNCFSLMHTLETNMDAKNWWFPIKKHLLASRGGHPFSGASRQCSGAIWPFWTSIRTWQPPPIQPFQSKPSQCIGLIPLRFVNSKIPSTHLHPINTSINLL